MVQRFDDPEPRMRPPRRRRPRGHVPGEPRYIAVRKLIPNMLTAGALVAGLVSFHFAMQGRFDQAMIAVAVSFILDGLDGRMARLLHATTRFGEKFDSIADFTAFGFAPAFLLYQWQLKDAGLGGLGLVMLYALCAAFRLARFTRQAKRQRPGARPGKFFQGCPAPAAAGLVLIPPMLQLSSLEVTAPLYATAAWTVLVALLMASKLPMFSPKGLHVRAEYAILLIIFAGLITLGLFKDGWLTASSVFAAYLLTLPVAVWWRRWERRRSAARALATGGAAMPEWLEPLEPRESMEPHRP